MTETYPWYGFVEGSDLRQGDLLDGCPVLLPSVKLLETSEGNEYELDGYIQEFDVIVMSQSCDLEQEKLDLVLVCPHWSLEEFGRENDYFKSRKGKEDLRRGNIPGYHVLRRCDLEGWNSDTRVVDFRNVYSLPYPFLKSLAAKRGQRLRLLSPYREHLSQAFARFFMRVGLPVPID
ncbi:hypothetical protein [Kamptonema formosum]|uniref:hypothetical protein n=1 Tax=Kamptonema formosum TaxID=331992 RepID=UPI00036FCCCC|nr:hypothetical protein [Oscillatoria sp. PCC 10802]